MTTEYLGKHDPKGISDCVSNVQVSVLIASVLEIMIIFMVHF